MSQKITYGYLDESPAISDEVLFFCVGILTTDDKTNQSLQKIIKKARKRIVKKKLKSLSEIKFHVSENKTREFVLKEIAKQEVKIFVLIIDKEKKVRDTPLNYGIVIGATIAEVIKKYPVLNLTLDKKYTDTHQEMEFINIVQSAIQLLAPFNKNIAFNSPRDSKEDSLLQLADFIAGAFNFKYNRKDNKFVRIIKKKIVIEKVVNWIDLKKRIVNP